MNKGKLIVIEGACDGIGKTTQYNLLKEYLESKDIKITSHHFPTYNSSQGILVENYLKGNYGEIKNLSPYFVNSLYAVDRAVTWITKLKPLYDKDYTVLLDRYTSSSLIYQAALIENIEERKKFIDYVIDFEYNKLGIKKPDVTIFLYASFDLVTKMRDDRCENEGISNDIHERDIEFMKKVYDNAIFIANYLNWHKIQCDENGSMRSIESIHQDICKLFK